MRLWLLGRVVRHGGTAQMVDFDMMLNRSEIGAQPVRVLVVEDESIVALDIQQRLETMNYVVAGAALTGEEALELAHATRPDIVLMDIRLKGPMSGIEAAEHLRVELDLPVIYLTAYADHATLEAARVSEPFGYVLKPFEDRELNINIEIALYRHQIQNRLHDSEAALRAAYASLERRSKDLATLYEVTAMVSERRDVDTVLSQTLTRLLAALACPAGIIHLYDDTRTRLRAVEQIGLTERAVAEIEHYLVEDNVAELLVHEARPYVVTDLAVVSKTPLSLLEDALHLHICAPMRARGEAVGIVSVFGAGDQIFRPEDGALLASIAGHAGVAVQNALLQRQAERAAAQEERRRVAQEIHDSVTQSIFSLIFTIGAARKSAELRDFDRIAETLEETEGIVRQALKDLRLLLYQLRSPLLEHEGLSQALRHRLNAVEGRAGIKTKLVAPPVLDLPPAVEEDIYRIAIEALNNALKHAKASEIKIEIRSEGEELIVVVADDGVGFDPGAINGNEGMGLVGMRERTARLGGSLSIESRIGAGAVVMLRLNRPTAEKTYAQD